MTSQPTWDTAPDQWCAVDALGRELPGEADCGPPRPGRYVGMFYFITHEHGGEGPYDVSKIIDANPSAPDFKAHKTHYWGEPEFGYYCSTDPWVIRKHGEMLADAGVDTVIFDTTNDLSYPGTVDAIATEWTRMRQQGERTPQFCYLASKESVRQIWEHVYQPRRHEDLWFQWKGRPLLLFGQHVGMETAGDFPPEIQEFFTLRASWAWDSLPWYRDGREQWPWVAHHPQCVGWSDSPESPEQVPVATGQHPLSNIGRSFHDGTQPPTNEKFLCGETPLGLCFDEQWKRALEVDPEFVFVTGWNEWVAHCMVMGEDVEMDLAQWCFFPGADLGLAGRQIKPGDRYFIDQFNQEFSRDIEPMKGGHGDNYYYQLVANVRRYKGVRPLPQPFEPHPVTISGGFNQWKDVTAVYRNHVGDGAARDYPGAAQAPRYSHAEARNRIGWAKVAHDKDFITFYAEAQGPLCDPAERHWMLLYISTGNSDGDGWNGYDLLVNLVVESRTRTTLHAWENGEWVHKAQLAMNVEGPKLMVSVPRRFLGNVDTPLDFQFKWADNQKHLDDIESFSTSGSCAPPRRFNYRYRGR